MLVLGGECLTNADDMGLDCSRRDVGLLYSMLFCDQNMGIPLLLLGDYKVFRPEACTNPKPCKCAHKDAQMLNV